MADAELAAAPPAVQESLVEAKLFGKWDFSDVEVRQPLAEGHEIDGISSLRIEQNILSREGCTP